MLCSPDRGPGGLFFRDSTQRTHRWVDFVTHLISASPRPPCPGAGHVFKMLSGRGFGERELDLIMPILDVDGSGKHTCPHVPPSSPCACRPKKTKKMKRILPWSRGNQGCPAPHASRRLRALGTMNCRPLAGHTNTPSRMLITDRHPPAHHVPAPRPHPARPPPSRSR